MVTERVLSVSTIGHLSRFALTLPGLRLEQPNICWRKVCVRRVVRRNGLLVCVVYQQFITERRCCGILLLGTWWKWEGRELKLKLKRRNAGIMISRIRKTGYSLERYRDEEKEVTKVSQGPTAPGLR